jgi:hypothetical protein
VVVFFGSWSSFVYVLSIILSLYGVFFNVLVVLIRVVIYTLVGSGWWGFLYIWGLGGCVRNTGEVAVELSSLMIICMEGFVDDSGHMLPSYLTTR